MDEFNQYRLSSWVDKGVWQVFDDFIDTAVEFAKDFAETLVGRSMKIGVATAMATAVLVAQATSWSPTSGLPFDKNEVAVSIGSEQAQREAYLDDLENRVTAVIASLTPAASASLDEELLALAKQARSRQA